MSQALKEFFEFCNDHKDPFNQWCAEIEAEKSRDRQIAALAAELISLGKPLREIDTLALETLEAMINHELLDRAVEKDPSLQELF